MAAEPGAASGDIEFQAVVGELETGRQFLAIGMEHVMGQMGQDGALGFKLVYRCDGRFDVEVEGVRFPAQAVDHQDRHSLQERQRGIGNGAAVGQIGE